MRRIRLPVLVGVATIVASVLAGQNAVALFGNRATVPDNTFSTTSLGPPGLLTGVALCAPNNKPRVDLDWTAASTGGTAVYKIYRSKTSNTSYAVVGETTALTYQDGGVQQSFTYWYKVESTIGGWTGGFSNEISVLTPDLC